PFPTRRSSDLAGDTGSTTADSATDTLSIAGAGSVSTSVSGDTLTITGTDTNTTYTAGDGLTLTGTDFDVVGSDTITVAADSVSVTTDSIGNTELEFDTGQALTTTSDVTFADLTLTSLTIGTIGLEDQGTSNTTSGASLVGVYDEFTNSSSTTIQGVLNDLDSAISGASHDAVTLVTTSHDYLTLADQAITLGTIDVSDDTNLTAGDHLTLTGDDLAVDDDFLLNTGDTASG